MSNYSDILVRDNFGDTGVTPSVGVPYQSPDIIPVQNGQLTWAQVTSTYANGPDLGKPIVQSGLNNIYVRAKNLQPTGTESGTAALSYAKASLLLLPNQWQSILTGTGGGSVTLLNSSNSPTLNPNDIALGNEAFVLTGLPPTNDHYCLVAIVTTPKTVVNVPSSFASNAAFASWVQNTPAVGWRNISIVPNTAVQIVRAYQFGSTSPTSAYFHFRIMSPSGANFPINTPVNVQCTDVRAPINWSGTLPPPDGQGNQITGFDASMPANFTASLTATLTSPNGAPFPAGAQLAISYYQYPSAAPTVLELATGRHVMLARHGADGVPIPVSGFFIPLGECWIYVEPGV